MSEIYFQIFFQLDLLEKSDDTEKANRIERIRELLSILETKNKRMKDLINQLAIER